ncbi:winged helix-turn-helix domain-containing tetratricopeptide repeat protein [Haliea sp. E17]|uniref:winged helix-turn-helix domain-containing tetratricopeptide repeat protein n=1 Tax=Haliea sp. E17 TaxID=3401576 RepID=UPI003AAE6820
MIFSFDEFELDLARAELRCSGEVCAIEPQVFSLIALLVENRDRLVTREEILDRIWDGRIVSDSALTSRIKSARRALGDDGKTQRFIKTVHGKGLRFIASAQIQQAPASVTVTEPQVSATESNPLVADSRPSIAVLPFRLLGEAGDWHTIADGLPHELIMELSRLRWLFVVARASSFRLRGEDVDLGEVRRLLGVQYCLSGTVEVSRGRLTVTAELAHTAAGDVIWAERYSGEVDDIHSMREQISSNILSQLEVQISLHEASRARLKVTENLDAWSAYHLGLQHIYRFNRQDNEAAAALFTRAVGQDPGFARAHAGLSFVHFQNAFLGQTSDLKAEVARARQCAQQGVDLDPLDPFVNFNMGRTYWLESDLERAYAWLERATSLSPNYAQGIYAKAWTETMSGAAPDAMAHLDLSMRLSPLDPLYYAMLSARGLAHITVGEDEKAADWADRGARSPGAHVLIAVIAAVACQLAGQKGRAQAWVEDVQRRMPGITRADFFRSFPIRDPRQRQRMDTALAELGFSSSS